MNKTLRTQNSELRTQNSELSNLCNLYSSVFICMIIPCTAMPRRSQSVPTNYLYFKNLIPVDINIEKLRI